MTGLICNMNYHLEQKSGGAPTNFQDNYYIYDPSLPAAIASLVLWLAITAVVIYRSLRSQIWYLTILVVGLLSKKII